MGDRPINKMLCLEDSAVAYYRANLTALFLGYLLQDLRLDLPTYFESFHFLLPSLLVTVSRARAFRGFV